MTLTVAALAEAFSLPDPYLRTLGLTDSTDGVAIPYCTADGRLAATKLRLALDGPRRFRWPAGLPLLPYGLWRLDEARRHGQLILVEGESDCWALWHHGLPALGLPGSNAAACLESEALACITTLYLHREPDKGGSAFVEGCCRRLRQLGYSGAVRELSMPEGIKDPAALHLDSPDRFVARLEPCLRSAPALTLRDPPRPSANGVNAHSSDEPPARRDAAAQPVPVIIQLSTVPREPVRWLMDGWIPDGTLTVLDGDPGLGKSTLTLDLAARISRGWAMPPLAGGEVVRPAAGVLLLGAEDALKNTVAPRLDAAGADSAHIHYFDCVRTGEEERDPVLPHDLPMLSSWLREHAVHLIIVDPLAAFIDSEFDAHKDQDIRRCLRALRGFAEKHNLAILLLRHLNKLNGGVSLYRGGGSIGITGAARASLIVGRDPEDEARKVLAMNKINLAPFPVSLAYRIEPTRDGASRIAWLGETELKAHEILWHHATGSGRPVGRPADQLNRAKELLREWLPDGQPVAQDDLRDMAADEEISWDTIRRAKRELGIQTLKMGSTWYWKLIED